MSSQFRYFEHNGKKYTYKEIAEISGMKISTLRTRVHDNPDITFEELSAPKQSKTGDIIMVEINGETKSLRNWARENDLIYDTIFARYRIGIRGEALIKPPKHRQQYARGQGKKPVMSPENIEWLQKTRKYRKGQLDEWEIACELIGAHPTWAGWLKKTMEERGLA